MAWLTACAIAFAVLFSIVLRSRRDRPPGPAPLPLVGNLHQLPKHNNAAVYRDWSRIYGTRSIFVGYTDGQLTQRGNRERCHQDQSPRPPNVRAELEGGHERAPRPAVECLLVEAGADDDPRVHSRVVLSHSTS